MQPPSGGCVLKRVHIEQETSLAVAAAFGRLCVETTKTDSHIVGISAAAFGRLCVETLTGKSSPA